MNNGLYGLPRLKSSVALSGFVEQWNMGGIYSSSQSVTPPAGAKKCFAYIFGQGGNSKSNGTNASTYSGAGAGCAYGEFDVVAGAPVIISMSSGQGGTSKISHNGVDLLTAIGANYNVAGTASKHASVRSGGAYSGGAGLNNIATASGASSGSMFGVGQSGTNGGGSPVGGSSWTYQGGSSAGAGLGNGSGDGLSASTVITDPLLFYFRPTNPRLSSLSGAYSSTVNTPPGVGGIKDNTPQKYPAGMFGGGCPALSGIAYNSGDPGGFGAGGGSGWGTNTSYGGSGGVAGGGAGVTSTTVADPQAHGGAPRAVLFWSA